MTPERERELRARQEELSPTAVLILDLLLARYRLGEPFWPIPTRNTKALDALCTAGLATYELKNGDYRTQLTLDAVEVWVNRSNYLSPLERKMLCGVRFRPRGAVADATCNQTRDHDGKCRQVLEAP